MTFWRALSEDVAQAHGRGDASSARRRRPPTTRRCGTISRSCASRRLRELAREFGYPRRMVEEAFDVFIQARNEVELYDDVLPALSTASRYRLFTASNGNADLGQIGIAHLVRAQRRGAPGRRAEAGPGHLPQGDRRHGPGTGRGRLRRR